MRDIDKLPYKFKNLIKKGFHIFPLVPDGKTPAVKNFSQAAVSDARGVRAHFYDSVMEVWHPFNIGIATTSYAKGALLIVDVDCKEGKSDGRDTLLALELAGFDLPDTLTCKTPTGGFHHFYHVDIPVKQGAHVLGPGLDVRSRGGYVVAAGSTTERGSYKWLNKKPIARAPKWVIDKCGLGKQLDPKGNEAWAVDPDFVWDTDSAIRRARDFLKNREPAIEGNGGDAWTYQTALALFKFGIAAPKILELLCEKWNSRCQPPWNVSDLKKKVANACGYNAKEGGSLAPAAEFEKQTRGELEEACEPWLQEMNERYAFMVLGGRSTIIETKNDVTTLMTVQAFKDLNKPKKVIFDGRTHEQSKVWFEHPARRSYIGMGMYPLDKCPPEVFNIFTGFAAEPLTHAQASLEQKEGLSMFKEHVFENICSKDSALYNWTMDYFAHLFQKPFQKPSTALVFRGEKGVGKNIMLERIGALLKSHFLVTSEKRYLISNFNDHMARLLLFVLDEAFWSGDKSAEGIMKGLITGDMHNIEQKGREPFSVKNLTRVCIIGNEDWLVPASHDERRFAVYDVGSKRKQDTKFFSEMKRIMDLRGGNRLLLHEFMSRDISNFNPYKAPDTEALLNQKIESFSPLNAWLYECIREEQISGAGAFDSWPKEISVEVLRKAYIANAKERGVRSYMLSSQRFAQEIHKVIGATRLRTRLSNGQRAFKYALPSLDDARENMSRYVGHKINFEEGTIDSRDIFS